MIEKDEVPKMSTYAASSGENIMEDTHKSSFSQSIGDENARAATELANARFYIEREGEARKQVLLAAGYSQDTIDRAGTRENGVFLTYRAAAPGQADAFLSGSSVEYGERAEGWQFLDIALIPDSPE